MCSLVDYFCGEFGRGFAAWMFCYWGWDGVYLFGWSGRYLEIVSHWTSIGEKLTEEDLAYPVWESDILGSISGFYNVAS